MFLFPVVDNVPIVGSEKMEKLSTIVKRIFGGVGTIREGNELVRNEN